VKDNYSGDYKSEYNSNSRGSKITVLISILFFGFLFSSCFFSSTNKFSIFDSKNDTFNILISDSISVYDSELEEYATNKDININIVHMDDLEIVDELNNSSIKYDAVWISNSMWLYMLDNSYLVTDSKSIAIDPVVIGIKENVYQNTSLYNKDITNRDILNSINNKEFTYVMTSPLSTNTGATAYLGFLNSLAGSPEVLKEEMLESEQLISDMKNFFNGVQRVSGDESYIKQMFLIGDYDAAITYESTLIQINKELESTNKETLHLLYPNDGVPLNDMPFGYIENNQEKEEEFKLIQDFLRSKKSRKKLEDLGFRTWYGGVSDDVSDSFNNKWGIDTTKYLVAQKFPSKSVMNKAFDLYVEQLRKPGHFVFCLDVSGSMYGEGLNDLKSAMKYILDYDSAKKDRVQFSKDDKVTIITFDSEISYVTDTYSGDNLDSLINFVDSMEVGGGTNIYDPSAKAIKILQNDLNDYTKSVILMTDGESNGGSISDISSVYKDNIPIYSITFGSADESQLEIIANLTNGKVFNGKDGLTKAFKEVRGYS